MPRLAVLIVAAGKGERAGTSLPKQYESLAGKPMLRRTVEAFAGYPVRIVIGAGQEALAAQALAGLGLLPAPVPGGATRQESVRLGLEALAPDAPDFVLIHDAARPLVSHKVIAAVIAALENGADGAMPMVAASDTLRRKDCDGWTLVPRDGLYRAQTPQGFVYGKIAAAHRAHAANQVTDDVALAELAGMKVEMVEGEEKNIKVTRKEDFALAEALLGTNDVRTATGYDVHKFTDGDHIMLCGLKIPHSHGLEGHSDADVGLHAITDALLGCIGEGDIGQHFPPTEERWRGAASWKFLDHAASLVRAKGGVINHVDVTIICERPKVGPHRDAMKLKVAEILAIDPSRVSIKATTTEGLGFTGRREGIAAQAIATVKTPMKMPRGSTVVASVFGIGYFEVAPGTIMSAIAVPLAILIALHDGGGMGLIGAFLIAFTIGVLACADHVRETKREDPSECVIDELAGQWLACAFCVLTFGGRLPVDHISIPAFALAFALFRLFDIWKPWPVSWADQKLTGGVGVMTDDAIAGLMAGVLVVAARAFFHL